MSRPCVMQMLFALEFGGAESLAVTISRGLNGDGRFRGSICGLYGGRGVLADVAERQGVPSFHLNAGEMSKLGAMRSLYRLLRRERVQVLQVHGAYLLKIASLPALAAGVKIIYTEHAKHSILKLPSLRHLTWLLSHLTCRVVSVSHNLRDFLVSTVGVSPSKIDVIYNGIDLSRFTCLPGAHRLDQARKECVIGTVARLSEPKDHGNLLRAFVLVLERHPRSRLVLVGDGELREEIEAMIQNLGLDGHVDMLGKRSDIPELLAAMDIFVLPSKREGFPISIIEAMACGKPVVATDVGGVREIIDDGQDGIIVPSGDHDALARALLRLANDGNLRERMGAEGARKAAICFSEAAMMDKYLRLFSQVGGIHA